MSNNKEFLKQTGTRRDVTIALYITFLVAILELFRIAFKPFMTEILAQTAIVILLAIMTIIVYTKMRLTENKPL